MPSFSHQTESLVSPPVLVEANGGPLSERNADGSPNSRNAESTILSTSSPVGSSNASQRIKKRLYASRIVSTWHQWPSFKRNLPLKSMHHNAFGRSIVPNGCDDGTGALRRRFRRMRVSPCRFKMSPMQLALGNSIFG